MKDINLEMIFESFCLGNQEKLRTIKSVKDDCLLGKKKGNALSFSNCFKNGKLVGTKKHVSAGAQKPSKNMKNIG